MLTFLQRNALAAIFFSEILAWIFFSLRESASAAVSMVLLAGVAGGWLITRTVSRRTGRQAFVIAPKELAVALAPSWLLFLDLLPPRFMLRSPSFFLVTLSASGSLYLLALIVWRAPRHAVTPACSPALPPAAARRPPSGMTILVFLAGLAAYTLLLFGGFVSAMPFSGDEPHYLLMARSIVRDGDLNLYEDYRQKRYLEFYPGNLDAHAYPGEKGPAHLYSKHMPALPLLLAPAYWCGEKLEAFFPSLRAGADPGKNVKILLARETMAVLAALLAAAFFSLAWQFSGSRSVAIRSWILFAFSLPLVAYARLLYTEIPVALILLLVLSRTVTGRGATSRSLVWTGLGISILPWFGIKYAVLAAAALLVTLAEAWRTWPVRKVDFIVLFAPLLASGALFAAYLLHGYGSISPFAVYLGSLQAQAVPAIHGLRFRPLTFFSTGLAYFLDQRIGLFFYSPLTILAVPGTILWLKRLRRRGGALLFVTATAWAFFALINLRQGHHPPGRELLPVLPILFLFAAGTLAWTESRAAAVIIRTLAVLGLLVALLGLWQPQLLFHTGLSSETWNTDTHANMLAYLSNAGFDFTRWLPNLIFLPDFSWIILGIWLAALGAASLAVLKKKAAVERRLPLGGLVGHLFFVIALSLFLTVHRAADIRLDAANSLVAGDATAYFQDEGTFGGEEGGFWTRGDGRAALVLRASGHVSRLHLELSSPIPLSVSLQIGARKFRPPSCLPSRYLAFLDVSPGPGKRWKEHHLYWIAFRVTGGFIPAAQEAGSRDRRYLGLFVRLAAELH